MSSILLAFYREKVTLSSNLYTLLFAVILNKAYRNMPRKTVVQDCMRNGASCVTLQQFVVVNRVLQCNSNCMVFLAVLNWALEVSFPQVVSLVIF